ncbi:MAG: TolC family protein [Alphaproteobacteria bacterium]|nr:TolC family protein [Alphaproteobacteria bacterium]
MSAAHQYLPVWPDNLLRRLPGIFHAHQPLYGRLGQSQVDIAKRNLDIQLKTLDLVRKQKEFGEAPQLDVERAETLVNTTRSSIPEFKRLADNARFRLSVLIGLLPENLRPILQQKAAIPGSDVKPVLSAPANIIALRPDVRAAAFNLSAATALAESAVADIFPEFTLSGFFNIVDNALIDQTSVWSVAVGSAVNLIDFGKIRGRIDAARAVEREAYEAYKKVILQSVSEVETALSDYAYINEQYAHLSNAFINTKKALELSQLLYREGEVSFVNVLEAQRTLNESDSALVNIESARAQSLVRLYKSLGIY